MDISPDFDVCPCHGWATELSHGRARILDVKIWGWRTNLNHTRPLTQAQWC